MHKYTFDNICALKIDIDIEIEISANDGLFKEIIKKNIVILYNKNYRSDNIMLSDV